MSKPLSLSDEQMDAIMRAAQPLPPGERSSFLEAVATALRDQPAIGDGSVHRTIVAVQQRFLRPPFMSAAGGATKWG